jgi:ribonuclease III
MLTEKTSGLMNEDAAVPVAVSLSDFEDLLGYRFKNQDLLLQALTHRSYVYEQDAGNLRNNESLEFLGDAVLGFVVSSQIFRLYPEMTEGDLSKIKAYLVSAANLFRLAERIRLGEFIRLSRGEEKTGGRTKRAIAVDAYEAVIGAIYLDGGVDAASFFVEHQIRDYFEGLDLKHLTCGDFKSALQEYMHNHGCSEPVYRVVNEIGPDHKKTFVVQVLIREEVVSESSGRTKKEAQQSAARLALESLRQSAGSKNATDSTDFTD